MIRDNKRKKLLLLWVLIGILSRFIFMPFTLHPDILHIYYHPYFLASKGIWDIYSYHADFFEEHRYHYYAPLTYLFFGSYLYLARPFLSGFGTFMESIRKAAEEGGGHSGHYLTGISTERLFRFLFLMKLPYLLFDIALLGLLMKFTSQLPAAKKCSGRQKGAGWWALNPLLIYTCYLFGQFDIIPTFLIAAAAYFAFSGKNKLAMISLGCGGALKSFPLFLIFPFSFYLGRDIKGIAKYVLIGVLPLLIIAGPFYLLSSGKVIGAFFSERISQRLGVTNTWGVMRSSIFILGYLILCLSLLRESMRERMGKLWAVKVSFFTLALLYIAFPISFHYFLWITPFVLILGCNLSSRVMNLYLLAVFSLGLAALAGKGMWFGLFSPIYPEFFIGLPGLDEIIKKFLPYILIRRAAALVFTGTLVWMSILVLRDRAEASRDV